LKPIDFISAVRNSDFYIEKIYLNGACYQFYEVLKTIFPNAEPHIDSLKGHIVTKIDGEFYDITGRVTGEYFPLTQDDKLMCEEWGFSKSYWLNRECPNCEELIPVYV